MTYEEAIKVLTDTRVMILKGSVTDLAKACSMAIEALGKQIPRKVLRQHGNYDCPICHKPAMTVTARKKNYCEYCGQSIDWSE